MNSQIDRIVDLSRIRFGTSSFSSKDWVGPFYKPGTPASDFLRQYSNELDTVEIDSTYYSIPSEDAVKGWIDKTPENFVISAKFPKSIVHCGKDWQPDPELILQQEATYVARDRFLEVMSKAGKKLGTLILQFPYFSKKVFASKKIFLERLEGFLDDLPGDFSYGVEIRNRGWLSESFADLLRKCSVSLVLVDHAWMPHADEIAAKFDPVTADVVYVRLIGDRKEIESITKTWGEEVIDRTDRLERWADFLVTMLDREANILVYVNNHFAGHAPATLRKLVAMLRERLSR
ncbi:MAG: DUF72 domain-containing protein [Candidatus Zixiibacteriota bacterium]